MVYVDILNNILIFCFALMIYYSIAPRRYSDRATAIIIGVSMGVLSLAYLAICILTDISHNIISLFVFSISSLVACWIISRYRGTRFLLLFCSIDLSAIIVTTVATDIGRLTNPVVSLILICVIYPVLLILVQNIGQKIAWILSKEAKGWTGAMLLSLSLYIFFYLFGAYPIPLTERPEYIVVQLFFLVVLAMFLWSLVERMMLQYQKYMVDEKNEKLELETCKTHLYRQLSYCDSLTGLPNRRALQDTFNRLRDTGDYCIAIVDVDNFKTLNDTLGHANGDKVLKLLTAYLKDSFSPVFSAYRYGGDEFVLVAQAAMDQDSLDSLFSKLDEPIATFLGRSISISYGVSSAKGQPEATLEEADKKLYACKHRRAKV